MVKKQNTFFIFYNRIYYSLTAYAKCSIIAYHISIVSIKRIIASKYLSGNFYLSLRLPFMEKRCWLGIVQTVNI